MQENETAQASVEKDATDLMESQALRFIEDMERTLDATKVLFSHLLKRHSTSAKRRVLIDLPMEDRNIWSVSLFTDRVYADESYAPRSLKGALAVAECLLKGEEPPKS